MEHMNSSDVTQKKEYSDKEMATLKQVSWNLFSMTGGIDEYLLYKKLMKNDKDKASKYY